MIRRARTGSDVLRNRAKIPAAERCRHPSAGKAVLGRHFLQRVREQVFLLDRAVDNRPIGNLRQRHAFQVGLAGAQNNLRHFDGTAADIQTDRVFAPTGDFLQKCFTKHPVYFPVSWL